MQTTLPLPRARGQSGTKRPRPRWVRWLLLPLGLLAIAGGYLWWQASQQAITPTVSTATITQGDLTIAVTGSGTVAAARTVDVPFEQGGVVTSVDVKIGDQVEAGQTLAQVDSTALQRELDLARANLATAEAQLAQVQNGDATAEDIESAQASLNSAEAQLAQTKTGTTTASDLASAQAQLTVAKAQLNALTNPSAADLSAAQRNLEQAKLSLQSTKDSASQSKTNAELALQNAVNSLAQAQSKYATAKGNWDFVNETNQDPTNPETTDSTGNATKNTLSDTQRQQYYDTYVQAEASLRSAENAVAQAQVAYDTARQNEVIQIQQAEANVQDAQDQLDALTHPSASDLAQAQASVTQAQASLDKLREGATAADLAQAQASVTQAQASLDKLRAPPTNSELASAQASVTQAQIAVDTAQANLDQATLKAPFAGVIAAVNIVPDSTISASTSAVTLVDSSTLHVDISLSETDAARVAVGQPVALSFDALSDVTLTGTVATVSPVASTEQNVVTYAVQVEFDSGAAPVKVGMSTTADIQVEQATNALLVPSRAIQTDGDSSTVTVVRGDRQVSIPVEAGLVSDGKTAITSASDQMPLSAGDVVVIPSASGSTSTTTTQSTTQQNALSGLTGGTRSSGFGGGTGGPPPGAP
jgi:HlyD family secretion protein